MIDNKLAVSKAGREIAHNIIWNAGYYKFAGPLITLVVAGLLPPRIRDDFGLPWNRAMALALDQFERRYRKARVVMPAPLLYRSAYLRGLKRTVTSRPIREGVPFGSVLSMALER